ncbi:MAG: tandem-95 repeat protein [Candidatus Cloacimonetes bacterium]|nr:tandem-95 repeat protein [Candidatus Cloacimonadota bacterium]
MGAFVGSECRAIGAVVVNNGQAISTMNIQGETSETVNFAVYDSSADVVFDVSYSTITNPGSDLGYPPNLLPIAAASIVIPDLMNCFSGESFDVLFPIGEYEVTLTVTDDDGATATETTMVTIIEYNEAPVADAGGPYEEIADAETELGTVTLDGSGSYDVDGEIVSWEWCWLGEGAVYYSRPWTPVIYSNSTVCYGKVKIDGEPAYDDDEVGAFIGDECRGVGYVQRTGTEAIVTMNIQGEEPEIVHFAVYDISEGIVCTVSYYTQTNPGGDLGYPPNELPIYAISGTSPVPSIFPRPWNVVYYTNSTVAYCDVRIDNIPASVNDEIGAFVDEECRAVGNIESLEGLSISTINIQGESTESVHFAVWDASSGTVLSVAYTTLTSPGNDLGYPPDLLPIYAVSERQLITNVMDRIEFPRPWSVVYYTNSTVAYCEVTIDDEPAAGGDEVGAFVANECRGIGAVVVNRTQSICTINIQGEVSETVHFAVYDASADEVLTVSYSTQSNPGNDIGYPPNLLPIAAETISIPEYENCYTGEILEILFPIGEYELTLTVTDDDGATASETTTVTIIEYNEGPIADADGPYETDAEYNNLGQITLNGSGSYDIDGEITSWEWCWSGGGSEYYPRPWTPVIYSNSTIAYGRVTIDGELAYDNDEVGSFIAGECRGVGYVQRVGNDAFVTMNIQGESVEIVHFAVYDISEDELCQVSYYTYTNPGFDIGYPPDNLPIDAFTSGNQPSVTTFPRPWNVVYYTNSTVAYGEVTIDGVPADINDEVGAFVNEECRAIGMVVVDETQSIVTMNIQGETTELVSFAVWDASIDEVISVAFTTLTSPGGDIGYPPNLLPIAAFSGSGREIFPRPWISVTYTNSTVAYGLVTIDGVPGASGDEVGAFVNGECRGIGYVTDATRESVVSINIQGESVEIVHFAVWDASEDIVLQVNYSTLTNPGGDIGYPPNLLPIAATSEIIHELENCVYGESVDVFFPVGVYNVTLTVTDDDGATATDQTTVTVNTYNYPPVADGNGPYEEIAEASGVAGIMLDGSGSYDLDGTIVNYEWCWQGSGGMIFPRPWNVVNYTNSTVAYARVTIDGATATVRDEVGAFVGGECRGVGLIILSEGNSYSTFNIQGEEIESVNFAVYEYSENQVWSVAYYTTTNPGNDIGYPPDFLPINASTTGINASNVFPRPWAVVNYTNSTVAYGRVTIDGASASAGDQVGAFVGDECRSIGNVTINRTEAVVTMNIQGETVETVFFAVWDSSSDMVYNVSYSTLTNPGGDIGYPPNLIPIAASSIRGGISKDVSRITSFPRPWIVENYTNSTVAYCRVTIDGENAVDLDEVAAFVGNECRGIAGIVITGNESIATMNIQGESVETVSFAVYDASEDEVVSVSYITQTSPGNDIGYPPNLLPIAAYRNQISNCVYGETPLVYFPVGTYNVTLTVTDDRGASDTDVTLVTVIEYNNLPVANAGGPYFEMAPVETGYATVTLDGSGSYDLDGEIITYEWCWGGSSGAGTIFPRPWDVVYYTNTTVAYGLVTIDGQPALPGDEVGAFVNNECRGIGTVVDATRNSIVTMNIQGETVENVYFAVWDASENTVLGVNYSTQTNPGNDIGYPPNLLPINAISSVRFRDSFPRPWIVVNYTNTTVAYGNVTIDGNPAATGDQVGAFVNNECRGVGNVTDQTRQSIVTLNIQGETVELVHFAVYDLSEDQVLSVGYTTYSNPGNDIGYPPDLLPIAAYSETFEEICIYGIYPSFDFTPGEYEVTLTVTDNDGATDSDVTTVTVEMENIAPVANAGEDYFEIAENGYATVTLDGSDSYDSDGDIISYYWNWEGGGVVIFPRPWVPVVYTNSTIAYGIVTIDGQPAGTGDQVAAFVGNECRGVANVILDNSSSRGLLNSGSRNKTRSRELISRVTLNIQGEEVETVQFAVWDYSLNEVYAVENTTTTNPGGDIGYPPNEINIDANSFARSRISATGVTVDVVFPVGIYLVDLTVTDNVGATDTDEARVTVGTQGIPPYIFPKPWNIVTYSNSTVAYGIVTIDAEPAAIGDEVGAFVGNECRAVASVYHIDSRRQREISAHVTMNIQGEVVELIQFAVWDASEDEVLSVSFTTYSDPGNDIGYPPDELPIAATTYQHPVISDYPWYVNPDAFDDYTTAVCTVFIDGEPAASGDIVGAFDVNGIPRGEGTVINNGNAANTTFYIYGNYPEPIYFAVWDISEQFLCYVAELTYSAPGNTIYITINAWTNMLPIAVTGGPYVAQADLSGFAAVELNGSASYDPDGVISSYLWTENDIILSETPIFTFNFAVGNHTLVLTVTDDDGGVGIASTSVEIISMENTPPIAVGDNYATQEDVILNIAAENGVLINDTDTVAGGWPDALTAQLTDNVIHGTLLLNSDGSFIYTPAENYFGQDRFRYQAFDGLDYSNEVLVLINISPINDMPVADADGPYPGQADATEMAEITLDGSASYDPDGQIITYLWTWNDTISIEGITATALFPVGPTTVTLTVTDNDGATDTDSTLVGVADYNNTAPVAYPDMFTVLEDETLIVSSAEGLLVNDTDDGYPGRIVAILADSTSSGILDYNQNDWDGAFSYTPGVNFFGIDMFTYFLFDGQTYSNEVSVTITIESVNDLPVADAGGIYQATANQMGFASVVLNAGNSTDIDGSIVFYQWTWNNNVATGMVVNASFPIGTTTVTLTVIDDQGGTDTDTALVGVAQYNNLFPVAYNDSYIIDEDNELIVSFDAGILTNDTDDGYPQVLTALLDEDVENGTLSLNEDGSFTYMPDLNFSGTDFFSYIAFDGQVNSDIATVSITVTEINDLPIADAGGPYNGVADNTDTALITLNASSSYDPDGSIVEYLWNWDGNSATGIEITAAFPIGTTQVLLTVTDDAGAVDTDLALVGVADYTNVMPIVVEDYYNVDEDQLLVVDAVYGVLANDSDDDYPEPLQAVLIDSTTMGVLSFNPDGSFTYQPVLNYFGQDFFTYSAFDGQYYSGIVSVYITINSVNDDPVAEADGPYNAVADTSDTALVTLNGSGSYDLDGTIISWTWSWDSRLASFTQRSREILEGEYVTFNFPTGTTPVTLTVTDNEGGVSSDVTVVSVASYLNQTPVAVMDTYSVLEDDILIVSSYEGVLSNDTDDFYPEPLTAVLFDGPYFGNLNLQPSGAFIYTPNPGYVGFDYFTYMAYDGEVNSPAVIVSIEVINVNDAPVIVLPDAFTFAEDTQLIVDLTPYIYDADGDDLLINVMGNMQVNVVINDYYATFTAAENWFGSEVIFFEVDDQINRLVAIDSVIVEVTPVNDSPVLLQEIPDYYVIENFLAFDIDLQLYFDDVDSELSYIVFNDMQQVNASVNNEILTISSVTGWFGDAQVIVNAGDGIYRASVSDTFMVYVAMGDQQELDLIQNWNWISFYVHPEDVSLNGVFDPLGDNVNTVKYQTQSAQYIPEWNDWMGDLENVADGQGYLVQMNNSFENFLVSGAAIPASTPIEMNDDWNWIAYYPHTADSLNSALASILDDVETVKDQQHSADYYLEWDLWLGDLEYMYPGIGYKIKMRNPATLVYPQLVSAAPQQQRKIINDNGQSNRHWDVIPGTENNMIVISELRTTTGNILPLNNINCGIFDINGNCRSNGIWQYVPQLDRGFWYFTVVGNLDNEPLVIVYSDPEGNEFTSDYEFVFQSDSRLGDPYNPIEVIFSITEGDEDLDIPLSYTLDQNYPNPFNLNSSRGGYLTTIKYGLPESGPVTVSIYNIKGQKVCDLVDEVQDAGYHSVTWNGKDANDNKISAGLYLYHLQAVQTSIYRKMIIIK